MPLPKKIALLAMLCIGVATVIVSCEKGPAEKAGKKIDDAVQDTRDAARDTAHDIKKDVQRDRP